MGNQMGWYKSEKIEFWIYEGPPQIELKYGLVRVHYEDCTESLSPVGFEIKCHGKKRPMNLEEIVEHRNTVTKALSEIKMEGLFTYQLWNDYAKFFNEKVKNFIDDKEYADKLLIDYKRASILKEAS